MIKVKLSLFYFQKTHSYKDVLSELTFHFFPGESLTQHNSLLLGNGHLNKCDRGHLRESSHQYQTGSLASVSSRAHFRVWHSYY